MLPRSAESKNYLCLNVGLFFLVFLGILYAVGGYDGATRQCLSTVEAYNPKNNTWSYIAEMGTRRSGAGVCLCVCVLLPIVCGTLSNGDKY